MRVVLSLITVLDKISVFSFLEVDMLPILVDVLFSKSQVDEEHSVSFLWYAAHEEVVGFYVSVQEFHLVEELDTFDHLFSK